MDRNALINQLIIDEGFRSAAYQDSLGYWTIGIGRMVDARKGGGISLDEAKLLLYNDITKFANELNEHIPWWTNMTNARQNVLLNMAFNLGINGLLGFKNTLEHMRNGRYSDAADNMLKSKWATQVGARAVRLAAIMRGAHA